jgi:hypothetical protein
VALQLSVGSESESQSWASGATGAGKGRGEDSDARGSCAHMDSLAPGASGMLQGGRGPQAELGTQCCERRALESPPSPGRGRGRQGRGWES